MGHKIEGPDGRVYEIPPNQIEDWDAWVLLHEGEGMPKWTPPPYAKAINDC